MNILASNISTRIAFIFCIVISLCFTGCKAEKPAPAPAAPAAPEKEAPKVAEAEKKEAAPAAAPAAPAAATGTEVKADAPAAEIPADKKNAILTLAADVACMEKVKSADEVAAFKNGRAKRRTWSVEDFDKWSKSLLATDETYKKRYDALLKNCPPENVSPEDQAKAESIYVDLVCLTKKGLPRPEIQKTVPTIYKKHTMSGPEYSRTMRSLLRDRSFGQALAKKIQAACPGPAKKPAGVAPAKTMPAPAPAAKPAAAPAKAAPATAAPDKK